MMTMRDDETALKRVSGFFDVEDEISPHLRSRLLEVAYSGRDSRTRNWQRTLATACLAMIGVAFMGAPLLSGPFALATMVCSVVYAVSLDRLAEFPDRA